MKPRRYLVMGAGEVGFHLARSLSEEGHDVAVIELDPLKVDRVKDHLDASMVIGNGAHRSVLEAEIGSYGLPEKLLEEVLRQVR